jgi:delta1-piperideine-2-carboxylate reductase
MSSITLTLGLCKELCLAALTSPRIALNMPSALAITKVVLSAESDGAKSHGLFRLPGYCAGILHGKVNPNLEPIITDVSPGAVVCDAQHGYAPLAFERALPQLVKKTKANGVGVLSIRNSFHFAALWYEAEQLALQNLSCIVCVNSKSFVAQPNGSGRRLYGTNPMAFGMPRKNGLSPLVIDQASSAMARGEIQMHQGPLPDGVGIDSNGQPTSNIQAVLNGAQLPFGGIKGANIAMMVELMAAGMTGSPFSFEAHDDDPHWFGPTRHGEFIIAIDPEMLGGDGEHNEQLFERLVMDGGRIPGSKRHQKRREKNDSIVLSKALYDEIVAITDGKDNITQGYLKK